MSAATSSEIMEWFAFAAKAGATHLIIASDTFDHEDYPVACMSDEETLRRFDELNGKNMQRVMEVYDLNKTWKEQSDGRVMNLPKAGEPSKPRKQPLLRIVK